MILMQKSKHFFNESQREMYTIRDETSAATTAKTNMENTHFLMKNILNSTLIKVMHYRISILWKTENENCSSKTLHFHFQMKRYVLNWNTLFNGCSNSPMLHRMIWVYLLSQCKFHSRNVSIWMASTGDF